MKNIIFFCIILSTSSFFCMEESESEPIYARGKELDLFQAIDFGEIKNVEKLLEDGVKVDIRRIYNGKFQEPLHFAVDKKNYEIIPLLCAALMSPHEKKFFKAVETNNIDKVKKLIIHKKRFPPDHQNKVGDTALMIAVKKNYYDMTGELLRLDFDIQKQNKMKETALTLAINAENSAMVEILLDNTVKRLNIDQQDNDGNTALMLAVKRKNKDILAKILAEVPDYSLRNYDNKTVIDFAQEIQNSTLRDEILYLLYTARPQFDLYKAITLSKSAHYIKNFITPDVSFTIKSIDRNPLIAAIRMDNGAAFKLFIELVDVNQKLKHNLTPLMLAVEANRLAMVSLLLQKRADPNARESYGNITPIFFALTTHDNSNCSRELVRKLLVNNGANVNHTISLDFLGKPSNMTPLMEIVNHLSIVSKHGFVSVSAVKELLLLRADPTLKNSEGQAALDIAQKNFKNTSFPSWIDQYGQIITLLEKAVADQSKGNLNS